MRQDAWRAYLEMALGVTEASTKKALKTAKNLVGKSGVSAEQLQGMADELVRTSAANREAVRTLVRVELERALNAVGLAKADEVETLTARVRELEAQLQSTKPVAPESAGGGPGPGALTSPGAKTVAKKTVAKKAVAPAPSAAEAPATTVAPAKTTAKKTVAKKAAPEKAAPAEAASAEKAASPEKTAPSKVASAKAVKKVAKQTAKATPSAVGEEITAPAPGPAGPGPRGSAPAKKAAKKTTTKRTPGSGEPVP